MPKIDFNEFQKQPDDESREYTFSETQTNDHQYYIKELGVVFDIIDLDFEGKGPGMEVLISLPGEDFKLRCDLLPKEILDTYDIPDYLIYLAEEYKPCLECKKKFLEGLCSEEDEIEFLPDDEDTDEDEEA